MYDDHRLADLEVYFTLEDDIKEAWKSMYPTQHLPLAACDSSLAFGSDVMLLQSLSSFSVQSYWFSDEGVEKCVVYRQPIKEIWHSFRMRVRWMMIWLRFYEEIKEYIYSPDGIGYNRAKIEFDPMKTKDPQCKCTDLMELGHGIRLFTLKRYYPMEYFVGMNCIHL